MQAMQRVIEITLDLVAHVKLAEERTLSLVARLKLAEERIAELQALVLYQAVGD